MNKSKSMIAAIWVLLISSCVHSGGTTSTKPDMPNSFYGTYMFVNPCHTTVAHGPDTKAFGAELAAALASGVVKTGIDWIGAALQRAAQDDIEKTTVSSNLTSVSQISNSDINICLQIVRGKYKYAESNENIYTNTFSVDPKKRLIAPLQVIEGTEELFIEILPIIHDEVVSFTPLEIRYSGYTPSDRRSKKPRDLALFIGYCLPDKDVSAGEYAGRLINFGTLTPDGNRPAIIKYVTDDGRLSLVNQAQWLSLADAKSDKPITFAANVIETRKAHQFAKFLASAFESSEENIKSKADAAVAELEIFKSSKELEKEKIETEKEKLANDKLYFDGVATVLIKEEALIKLCGTQPNAKEPQIYKAQADLYFAKKNVNVAAASAGRNRPYKDSQIKLPDGKCGG